MINSYFDAYLHIQQFHHFVLSNTGGGWLLSIFNSHVVCQGQNFDQSGSEFQPPHMISHDSGQLSHKTQTWHDSGQNTLRLFMQFRAVLNRTIHTFRAFHTPPHWHSTSTLTQHRTEQQNSLTPHPQQEYPCNSTQLRLILNTQLCTLHATQSQFYFNYNL